MFQRGLSYRTALVMNRAPQEIGDVEVSLGIEGDRPRRLTVLKIDPSNNASSRTACILSQLQH